MLQLINVVLCLKDFEVKVAQTMIVSDLFHQLTPFKSSFLTITYFYKIKATFCNISCQCNKYLKTQTTKHSYQHILYLHTTKTIKIN